MEYLTENDTSLSESLEIADGLGYKPSDLNSEILATLLKSQNIREEFFELRHEINDFFETIKEKI